MQKIQKQLQILTLCYLPSPHRDSFEALLIHLKNQYVIVHFSPFLFYPSPRYCDLSPDD